ncbi:ATP synthase [Lithospermum erythrorhizon]|uniref:ATP synthase n=1 Tax=Lithospermum erythrorhizon TaxID=34254 RepID=A0AAV3QDG6_LITER
MLFEAMALNENDNLYSRIRLDNGYVWDDCFDKNIDGFQSFRAFNWEMGNSVDHKREKSVGAIDNVADLLPKDPFDMNIFSGLLDDLERDLGLASLGFVDCSEGKVKKVDNKIFAGLNIVFNGPLRLRPECVDESELEKGLHGEHLFLDGGFEEIILGYEKYSIPTDAAYKDESCTRDNVDDTDGCGGRPPEALNYALNYLSVEDLLSVERVCKSLRDSAQNDPLLWRNIHIDHPLSYKITDDGLVRLTNRALGRLQSLSLLKCFKITSNSLKQVLQNNPSITKLSVTGCIKLRIDDLLCNLRVFKSVNPPGIKHLRVAGLLGLKIEHFEELKHLLGLKDYMQSSSHKPRFYHDGEMNLSLDDARAIDLETCPRCLNIREVYDCPAVSCQGKKKPAQSCRACSLCIPRCFRCGRCLSDRDYEENFFFFLHCLDCDNCCPDFQEGSSRISISPKHTYLHQKASYHCYLCG